MVQRQCHTFQIVFRKGISKIGSNHVRPIPEPLPQVLLLIIHSGHEITTSVSFWIQLFPRIHVELRARSRLSHLRIKIEAVSVGDVDYEEGYFGARRLWCID
jgi:hypothetical protein